MSDAAAGHYQPRAQVIIVSGASGSGKSRLARQLAQRFSWPFVNLDDFYKDHDAPNLPRLPDGQIDWDSHLTWNADDAVDALETLCRTGRVEAPTYSISESRREGSHTVELGASRFVVAEGIFAPHAIAGLRERGLLAEAWCLARNRYVTATRRLVRDLAEHRKPPLVLLRRGWRLCQEEPGIVASHIALGAEPLTFSAALDRSTRLHTST